MKPYVSKIFGVESLRLDNESGSGSFVSHVFSTFYVRIFLKMSYYVQLQVYILSFTIIITNNICKHLSGSWWNVLDFIV